MGILRLLVIGFNVVVVTYLIFRLFEIVQQPLPTSKKMLIIAGAVILLLAPFGMFFNFFMPTVQYFLIYPVAIGLYLYMIRML